MVKKVDYDRIAPTYNRRFLTGSGLRSTAAVLDGLTSTLDARRILEVGCGTGYWLETLYSAGRRLYGLDLASGMLQQARQRAVPLLLAQGQAGQIAFQDGHFDLVFCVNAIHHFQSGRTFVAEARRVLRPGGALAIVGNDPRARHSKWYIYDYFEGTLDTDLARFPSWGTVFDWLVDAGLERTTWQIVERFENPKVGRAVLSDPFLQKNSCSQLALLSDEEYAAGLRSIEAALAGAEREGRSLTFPCEFTTAMLVGLVPDA